VAAQQQQRQLCDGGQLGNSGGSLAATAWRQRCRGGGSGSTAAAAAAAAALPGRAAWQRQQRWRGQKKNNNQIKAAAATVTETATMTATTTTMKTKARASLMAARRWWWQRAGSGESAAEAGSAINIFQTGTHQGVECFIGQLDKLLTHYGSSSGLGVHIQVSLFVQISHSNKMKFV
jgi:hypothetical protein